MSGRTSIMRLLVFLGSDPVAITVVGTNPALDYLGLVPSRVPVVGRHTGTRAFPAHVAVGYLLLTFSVVSGEQDRLRPTVGLAFDAAMAQGLGVVVVPDRHSHGDELVPRGQCVVEDDPRADWLFMGGQSSLKTSRPYQLFHRVAIEPGAEAEVDDEHATAPAQQGFALPGCVHPYSIAPATAHRHDRARTAACEGAAVRQSPGYGAVGGRTLKSSWSSLSVVQIAWAPAVIANAGPGRSSTETTLFVRVSMRPSVRLNAVPYHREPW